MTLTPTNQSYRGPQDKEKAKKDFLDGKDFFVHQLARHPQRCNIDDLRKYLPNTRFFQIRNRERELVTVIDMEELNGA